MDPRVAIFGDVGGWCQRLEEALTGLGADWEQGALPEHLEVVQVGDLVHKGPDSVGVLALVDRFLYRSPGRWHQLMGNHEAQYFGAFEVWRSSPLAPIHQSDLKRWRTEGNLALAAAVDPAHGAPILVTHAGLTRPRWEQLGRPQTPAAAVEAIEAEIEASGFATALAAGMGAGGRGPNEHASVVWAMPYELLWSWAKTPPPFSMVVGHANPFDWHAQGWARGEHLPDELRTAARLYPASRHVRMRFANETEIVFVDPAYGRKQAEVPLVPLLIEGRVVA